MTNIQTYQDLVVWKKSVELSVLVYQLTNHFPKQELFGITMQIRRAVVSIASNIAEGNGRGKWGKEYRQFLRISRGSLQELETQLIIAERLGYIKDKQLHQNILELTKEVEKMLNTIISRL